MALFPSCLLLTIYAISTHAGAASITLSSELTNFIPLCAQDCFGSFIEENYSSSVCSTAPTLDCLCSHNTTSGYTIGEGAVQCILSEDDIGFCQGADARAIVVTDAYSMCSGQIGALPETHSTITATLIEESSMPSILLVAPLVTISISYGSGISSFTSVPSTTALLSTSGSRSLATPASSSSSITPKKSTPTPQLSKPTIAGIAVASIGGSALVVGSLILCACCLRRRRRAFLASRDSDMIPFQSEPIVALKYDRVFLGPTEWKQGPGGTLDGVAAKVPPRRPPRIATSSPNMFSRRSIRPETIGLAISPDTNDTVERRRSSKLLPEKPSLTLTAPRQVARRSGGRLRSSQPKVTLSRASEFSRASTGTQFEEDNDSTFAAEDINGRLSTDKDVDVAGGPWQPQPSHPLNSNPTIPFSTPLSFVVAGGISDPWKPQAPNTSSVVPEYYVQPLNLSGGRTAGSFSQPRLPEPSPRKQLQKLQIPTQAGSQNARPITNSSSIYSAHPTFPPGEASHSNSPQTAPASRTLKSSKQSGPYDFDTGGALTLSPQEPRTATTDLSPVAESPSGRSPVSYPKIPRRLSENTIKMVPPPLQPDFSKPWRQAEIAAQRARINAQQGQQQGQQQQQRQRDYMAPSARYNAFPSIDLTLRPRQGMNPDPEQRVSGASSVNSTSSSLLAKRRGEKLAAALALGKNEEDAKRQQAKWRVLKDKDIEAAKSPGWKPLLACGRETQFETVELPATPGWVPKLTPTRRGDDLFLSVQ